MNTLNYFVASYKLSHDILGSDYDQKYLQMGIDCLKQLRAWKMMDFAEKWAHCDIQTSPDGSKWAHLPADYRRYLWVGQCCGNNGSGFGGNFVSFDLNNDLCEIAPWDGCSCSGDSQVATVQSACCGGGNDAQFNGTLYWGNGAGEPYSYSYNIGSYAVGPVNIRGTFKMDTANNRILFDRCVNHAVIKYEGDFLTGMGNCFIPPGIEDNMIIQNYMEWRSRCISPDANLRREANQYWTMFFQSVRDYNSQRNALNKDEWLTLIRRFTYMGVKS